MCLPTTRVEQVAMYGGKVNEVTEEIIETADSEIPILVPDLPIQHCVPVDVVVPAQ